MCGEQEESGGVPEYLLRSSNKTSLVGSLRWFRGTYRDRSPPWMEIVHVFPKVVVSTILVFYFYNIVIVVPPKSWGRYRGWYEWENEQRGGRYVALSIICTYLIFVFCVLLLNRCDYWCHFGKMVIIKWYLNSVGIVLFFYWTDHKMKYSCQTISRQLTQWTKVNIFPCKSVGFYYVSAWETPTTFISSRTLN